MEASRDRCEDGRFHEGPVVDDQLVVESECGEPVRSGHRIAHEVLVSLRGLLVVQPAVDLEDEPIPQDEVHATDAWDLDLRTEREADPMEADPEQGFESALGVGSSEVHNPASRFGDPPAEGPAISRREFAGVEGRLEGREDASAP